MIDLKRNCLVIGTTATEAPFLPESELPDAARLSSSKPESDQVPGLEAEDAGLAQAIEQSVKDEQQRRSGNSPSTSNPTAPSSSKRMKKR